MYTAGVGEGGAGRGGGRVYFLKGQNFFIPPLDQNNNKPVPTPTHPVLMRKVKYGKYVKMVVSNRKLKVTNVSQILVFQV